jgi:plastocyanin
MKTGLVFGLFLAISLLFSGLLTINSCAQSTATPSTQPTTAPTINPATGNPATHDVTINLSAKNLAFNVSTMSAAAGASVTVNFSNQEAGIPHNFAVYTDATANTKIFVGQIITGPSTMTYKFTAPSAPGSYFFRCDVHPTMMTGVFTVTAK